MTTPLDQAIAAVQALAAGDTSALQAVQTQLAQVQLDDNTKTQLLTAAQSQLAMSQAQNVALVQQVDSLTAQLAALQPPAAGPDIGISMNTLTQAEADALHAATGATHFRGYVPPSLTPERGAAALAWLPGSGYTMDVSIHSISGVPALTSPAETDQQHRERATDLFAAGNHPHQAAFLTLAKIGGVVRFIFCHEPDQKNRTRAAHLTPALVKLRQTVAADGHVTAELWLVLTGSAPPRGATWYPGPGVVDGIGYDPYTNSTNVAAYLVQFAQSIADLNTKNSDDLKWGVFEFATFKYQDSKQTVLTTAAQVQPVLAAFLGADVLALKPACLDWYNINVDAGYRIDNNPTLASAFKQIATMA